MKRKEIVTLASSTVDAESISIGTLARVTTRCVFADADAEIVVLELRALINVVASSIVGI